MVIVKVISKQEVLQEAMEVLSQHVDPAKAARFWVTWQIGGGNYLALREQLFAGENSGYAF
jgi:hypothetical protein